MKLTRWIVVLLTAALLSAVAQTPTTVKGASDKAKSAATTQAAKLLDINSASADDLKALPGIGDKYSAKIIAGRPYVNKTQLKSKGIIPDATYSKIEKLIVASKPK